MAEPVALTVIRERDSVTSKQHATREKNLTSARKLKSDIGDEGNSGLTKKEQSKLDYMHVTDIISKLKQKDKV